MSTVLSGMAAWPHVNSPGASTLAVNLDFGPGLPKPKRRKIETACESCRQRKSRCDGARPKCGPCMRRKNVGDTCTYLEGPRREQVFKGLGPLRTQSEPSHSSDRCTTSQAHLERGGPGNLYTQQTKWMRENPPHRVRPKSLHSSIDERSPRATDSMPAPPTPSVLSNESPPQDSTRAEMRQHSPHLEDDDLDCENDATDHEDNWIVKAGLLGASSSASFISSICKAVDRDETPKTDKLAQGLAPNHASSRVVHKKRIRSASIHSAEYVLPSRKLADRLLDLHWKCSHVPWIDRLRLMNWYEGLWTGRENVDSDVDEQVYHCILNTVFALAFKGDPTMSPEDQERLSEAYFLRAQKLLSFNLLDINYIGLVQALLLMGQYLQSTNMTRHCFQCVGLAILIAQHLGLHIPQTISSIRSQHDREMARRAWHGCILMDRITSMTFGRQIRISQEVARQSPLPAAIDEEYLEDGDSEGAQPIGQPSRLCFFLAYCKLHIILGDVLSTFYHGRGPSNHSSSADSNASTGKQDIDKIIEFDHALGIWLENLEDHLQVNNNGPADPRFRGQAVNLCARFLHIRMLLYRTFFSQSPNTREHSMPDRNVIQAARFADTVTRQGLVTCVKAAQQILELISSTIEGENSPGVLPPWYHVISYVYTAVTIVIAAHLFPYVTEQVSVSALKTSTSQGFDILEHYGSSRNPAQRCKRALTVLYDKITSPKEENYTPKGTLVPPGPEVDANANVDLPADLAWDVSSWDLFGDGEIRWFNSAPFDPDSNFWL